MLSAMVKDSYKIELKYRELNIVMGILPRNIGFSAPASEVWIASYTRAREINQLPYVSVWSTVFSVRMAVCQSLFLQLFSYCIIDVF